MNFNKHFDLAGKHAFLSPSKHAWTNYDEEKLDRMFVTAMTAQRGTELHEYAHAAIRLRIKQRSDGKTLTSYINDAIQYNMIPEQILYFSEFCYGTADAISFIRKKLRVFDLKNGVTETSVRQLEVYVALFCLEYGISPFTIEMEMRIYQSDEVKIYEADPDDIFHLMEHIKFCSARLTEIREEASA